MTNEHTLFERVAKGLCVRVELETEQTGNILTPSSSGHSSTSSSFCWAAQPGSWGPKPSVSSWFSLPRTATRTPTNWLQLTRTVCGTGLCNCLTSTSFMWPSHLHRIQPVHTSRLYLDVFDRVHLLLDWGLGRRSICYTECNEQPLRLANNSQWIRFSMDTE